MEDTSFAETTDYDTDCVGESRFDKFMNQTGSKSRIILFNLFCLNRIF